MKKGILAVVLCFLLAISCRAVDVLQQEADILHTDSLYDGLSSEDRDKLEGIQPTSVGDFGSQMWNVLSDSLTDAGENLREGLTSACSVLAAAILCAAVDSLDTKLSKNAIRTVGAISITLLCTANLRGMIGLSTSMLDKITNFSVLLLPTLSSAAAASGAMTASAALYVGSSLFMSILSSLIRSLLIPFVYAFVGLSTAESALGDDRLSGLRKLIGWVIQEALRTIMYLFTGYLTITGILSGSADVVTLKAAKAALSGAIPVVGGIASDATETVLAGAGVLKNAIGIFGMMAVLAIGIAPFFRIGISYLCLKLVTAVSTAAACKEHIQLLENLTAAMGYLLAMAGCSILMTLVSCSCFIKVVSG